MIGQTLSHYRITAALGAGGMGEVYRATDTKLGREVAIKVLPAEVSQDPQRLARFEREAHLLAALNHPNVGAIYGLEEVEGKPFLVLELVEGEELQQRLERGAIPVDEAIEIARQIAEGLEAAHEKGVVHRDLKPANVKVTPEGKVKVLDFGLAKVWDGDPGAGSSKDLSQSPTLAHTGIQAGMILGTAAYMSPEQARGDAVDRRSDVWALGAVLWEMLTGRQLFKGDTVSDILAAVLTQELDWRALPSSTPVAVRRLLRRCLARSPHDRLHDIADARLELAESLSDAEREEELLDAPHVSEPPLWRRVLPWGLATVLAVACLALVLRPGPEPPLMKLEISAPEDTVFGVADGQVPKLSPDGRRLVFSARDAQGRIRLYVRPLDAQRARELPGTEGALYPFWSPDSRHIGFFAAGKLLKVEATGGATVDLCRAPNGRGGTWSRDGIIVFSPGFTWPLHRVPDTGGESTPITKLDETEKAHRNPRFLPDGRHFIYLAWARGDQDTDVHAIRLGSLDGSASELLLHSPAGVEYASGHLLYLSDDTLMARPFDAERRELTGTATPVAENVTQDSANADGFFSASENGVLAFWTGARVSNANLVWYNRSGEIEDTSADPAPYLEVVLAPDGSRAAVSVLESSWAGLWVYDIPRDLKTRFTLDPTWAITPAWSPDGSALVFATLREGQFDLYRKAFGGGSEAEPVLTSPDEKLSVDVSRDGQWLSFNQDGAETGRDVWVLPLNGEGSPRPFLQTRFEERGGSFSPDGRWLAYQSDESGRFEIYVAAFPDGGRKQQISGDGGMFPSWRMSGQEMFYHALDGTIASVEVETAGEDLVVGAWTSLFRMTPPGRTFRTYSPTPDGQRFLIIAPEHIGDATPVTLVLNWTAVLEDPASDR